MPINHHLQPSALRPTQRLAQFFVRTTHVRVTLSRQYTPVSNRDADKVQPCPGHLVEVILREPAIPVGLETRACGISAELLGEGVLIDGVVALEDRRCNPGLEDEPAACIYAANLLPVEVKGRGALDFDVIPIALSA